MGPLSSEPSEEITASLRLTTSIHKMKRMHNSIIVFNMWCHLRKLCLCKCVAAWMQMITYQQEFLQSWGMVCWDRPTVLSMCPCKGMAQTGTESQWRSSRMTVPLPRFAQVCIQNAPADKNTATEQHYSDDFIQCLNKINELVGEQNGIEWERVIKIVIA